MELKSFGCSFIYGTDLPDAVDPSQYSCLTWPALLAKKLQMPYRCYAGGGHGNLSIFDRLSREIYEDPQSLFVIQWTYIDRFDYSDPNGHHFNTGNNDWSTIRPNDQSPQADFYFRQIHSEYRDKLTSLIYIKTALELLRKNHCKFLMTCMDRMILCDHYHSSPVMQDWQKQLQTDLLFFEEQDFLHWSLGQGFATGRTNHPLEQAHAAAADLMIPAIDAILRRA